MPQTALTSAELSLPVVADVRKLRTRIAALATDVDVVGLTDNHAGRARLSPLAGLAIAREEGVPTIVHVSCRDRNRLALQSQVMGAAALGAAGLLCLYGDPVPDTPRVGDMTTTSLLAAAGGWAAPAHPLLGCVVNPFVDDVDRELRLLAKKVQAGARMIQTQMVFDTLRLEEFLQRAAPMLDDVRVFASVGILRGRRMADYVNASLPGLRLPDAAYDQVLAGGGVELAEELSCTLATLPGIDALHVVPLGAEAEVGRVARAFRRTRERDLDRGRVETTP